MNPPSHTPSVESLPVMTIKNTSEDLMNDEDDPGNLLIFDESPLAEDNVSICSKDPSIDSSKASVPVYFRLVLLTKVLHDTGV
jgi:hypothetical protein